MPRVLRPISRWDRPNAGEDASMREVEALPWKQLSIETRRSKLGASQFFAVARGSPVMRRRFIEGHWRSIEVHLRFIERHRRFLEMQPWFIETERRSIVPRPRSIETLGRFIEMRWRSIETPWLFLETSWRFIETRRAEFTYPQSISRNRAGITDIPPPCF
jgi:hypothetical protein